MLSASRNRFASAARALGATLPKRGSATTPAADAGAVKAPASNIDAAKTQGEKASEFFREYKELGIVIGVVVAGVVYSANTRSMIQTLRDEMAIMKEQLDGKINFIEAELKLAIAKSDNGILKHLHELAAYSEREEAFVQEGKQLAIAAALALENREKAAQKNSIHSGQMQREEVVTAAEGSGSGGEQQHQGASMPQIL
jgi:hypothetical protein